MVAIGLFGAGFDVTGRDEMSDVIGWMSYGGRKYLAGSKQKVAECRSLVTSL